MGFKRYKNTRRSPRRDEESCITFLGSRELITFNVVSIQELGNPSGIVIYHDETNKSRIGFGQGEPDQEDVLPLRNHHNKGHYISATNFIRETKINSGGTQTYVVRKEYCPEVEQELLIVDLTQNSIRTRRAKVQSLPAIQEEQPHLFPSTEEVTTGGDKDTSVCSKENSASPEKQPDELFELLEKLSEQKKQGTQVDDVINKLREMLVGA